MPFDHLASLLLIALVVLMGVAVIAIGTRRRRATITVGGMLAVALGLLSFGIRFLAGPPVELNPRLTDVRVQGIWTASHVAIEVAPRFEYRCRGRACSTLGSEGQWRRVGDFELELVSRDGRVHRFRVVEDRGRLKLIEPFEDPDNWNGRFAFQQVSPAV